MGRNIFDVMKDINADDTKNGSANLAIYNELVSASKVKAGGHVTIGVPESTVMDIILKQEDKIVLLLVIDRKTYESKDN